VGGGGPQPTDFAAGEETDPRRPWLCLGLFGGAVSLLPLGLFIGAGLLPLGLLIGPGLLLLLVLLFSRGAPRGLCCPKLLLRDIVGLCPAGREDGLLLRSMAGSWIGGGRVAERLMGETTEPDGGGCCPRGDCRTMSLLSFLGDPGAGLRGVYQRFRGLHVVLAAGYGPADLRWLLSSHQGVEGRD
jgi:hypothetical protein